MITGVDIVREQILIADGQKLSLTQEAVKIKGSQLRRYPWCRRLFHHFLMTALH
jgi:acetyl/propionyl-CoA carboxylase alpha subunit